MLTKEVFYLFMLGLETMSVVGCALDVRSVIFSSVELFGCFLVCRAFWLFPGHISSFFPQIVMTNLPPKRNILVIYLASRWVEEA